jgi:poly-gamma-glutamate synthesis protein (capsule biosynthesis protein)
MPAKKYGVATISLFVIVVAGFTVLNCTRVRAPEAAAVPPADCTARVRLVFAGDLMQHLPQVSAARRKGGGHDYSASFRYVQPIFREADLAILNFETTLTPSAYYTGYPRFRSPSPLAGAVKDMGVDVVVLANNHICDYGTPGLEYTLSRFDSLGIAHTGAFADSLQYRRLHPLRMAVGGMQFALFNYTYDTNGMPVPKGAIVNLIDTAAIAADLSRIDRTETDCVIVFFHWGDEYIRQPNPEQRRLAEFCHQRGAEIVVGSHPHVIQPIETHPDEDNVIREVTVYSLGNLVSNQRNRYRDGGLIVTLNIEKKEDQPVCITPSYTPVWVSLPDYRIVPPSVADTLSLTEDEQLLYQQFMQDTRALLDSAGWTEESFPVRNTRYQK